MAEEIKRGNFTINIPEPLQRMDDYFGQGANPLDEIYSLLGTWDRNLSDLTERIIDIASYYDEAEVNRRIFNNAFIESEQIVRSSFYTIIMMHLYEACVRSNEFNYIQYIEQLSKAVIANLDEGLIFFTPDIDEGHHQVDINFTKLGRIEEWAKAVEGARKDLGLGKKDNPLASKMWREKIYGTAREGVTISRYYKREDVTRDITARYSGKYALTIRTRLNKISPRKAPFWELLLHGNSAMQGSDGEAYPTFRGYDFIGGIADDIIRLFKETYERLVDRLTDEYRAYINEQNPGYNDYEATPPEQDILTWTDRQLGDIDREAVYQEKGQRSLERFTIGKYEVQPYITSAGGIGHRVFEMNESGKHHQVKNEIVLALGLSL